jgi:hypothetical protein
MASTGCTATASRSSDNFEYAVFPNGSNRPASGTIEIDESTS